MIKKRCPCCGRGGIDYLEGSMAFVEHENTFGDRCNYSGHSDQDCCVKKQWPEIIGTNNAEVELDALDLLIIELQFSADIIEEHRQED